MAPNDGNLDQDIETGRTYVEECSGSCDQRKNKEVTSRDQSLLLKFGESQETWKDLSDGVLELGDASVENVQLLIEQNVASGIGGLASQEKVHEKDKRLKSTMKKPCKPPRPPKGPSLSASDLKLVREISQVAAMKRARTERMRAYRKMKAAKGSSSAGSLTAMVITVVFFIIIIVQGVCSRSGIHAGFQGSPEPAMASQGFISFQFYSKPPESATNGPISQYPSYIDPASQSDPKAKDGRDAE